MSTIRSLTTTELLAGAIFLALIGGIFYAQRAGLTAAHRDTERKTAINAMYYNLVEVVKPTLGGYPRVLKTEDLKAMDPALLKDPQGVTIGVQGSDYRYEPTECNGGDVCQSFTLRANMEREDTFVKQTPR